MSPSPCQPQHLLVHAGAMVHPNIQVNCVFHELRKFSSKLPMQSSVHHLLMGKRAAYDPLALPPHKLVP